MPFRVAMPFVKILGRRAVVCAALSFCLAVAPGCALIRIPFPPITLDVNVFESETLPGLPRIFITDPRLGVFGLELSLPRICELGEVDFLARSYLQRLQDERLGELSNNIEIKRVLIKEVRLTAEEGNFAFLSEAGIRFAGEETSSTYWTTFLDRPDRQKLVFRPDQAFDVFDLIPGEDECITTSLIYSGTYPSVPVTFSLDLVIEVRADWRF